MLNTQSGMFSGKRTSQQGFDDTFLTSYKQQALDKK